ncbi:MAG: citrate lyase subunit alpha [Paludibacterium sp.]|uniref:citrate lyase subunit alpha n=1 Tax=Paludibacterium sp. TaxID=1917523 RepID=UPI0025EB7558|nr:citrate lyase subunit alpha [Paludibacterium sp.]MBV8045700.1 citrate lyase subunit alpha [Paludibacterium sp.]MBV8649462.1 citrate lyase subunit alpha [Paludibacterium sp.]
MNALEQLHGQFPDLAHLRPFAGAHAASPHLADPERKAHRKLAASLEDAIAKTGLKNGMTISFHHAFREGDKVINLVVDTLARLGLRDLTLATSSLLNVNAPLIEHIKNGVITQIYTSGMRGKLAEAISNGLMERPVQIHSHGGRVHLLQSGELNIDVAFLGVPCCDEFGNANGAHGKSRCGSLGYAKVDAQFARQVVLLTDEIVGFPNVPVSISQDRVDYIVKIDEVGDPSRISVGAARVTSNPRELMIARFACDVIEHSGYFNQGFSLQTGSGAASTAATRFLEHRMLKKGITASYALGGITGSIVDLHKKGLIETLIDTQSFDTVAAESLAESPRHLEVSTNEYANPSSKGTYCDRVDVVILSALEIDCDFNVNVITGSDGVMRGASGGHCDVAAASNLTIVVAPLIRSRIPTVVRRVTTIVTPGESIDVLVTDHGIAVNPARPEVAERLRAAGLPLMDIDALYQRAVSLTGEPQPIAFTDKIVGVIRYRDGSVIDVVRQVQP